jgi:hypothetical protein
MAKAKRNIAEATKGAHFVLCDDVRQEVHDKITIIGAYLNDELIVLSSGIAQPTPKLPDGIEAVLDSLALVVSCPVKPGEVRRLSMFTPGGKVHGTFEFPQDEKSAKAGTGVLAFRTRGFPVPEFGRYRVELRVGEKEYQYSFSILDGRS